MGRCLIMYKMSIAYRMLLKRCDGCFCSVCAIKRTVAAFCFDRPVRRRHSPPLIPPARGVMRSYTSLVVNRVVLSCVRLYCEPTVTDPAFYEHEQENQLPPGSRHVSRPHLYI